MLDYNELIKELRILAERMRQMAPDVTAAQAQSLNDYAARLDAKVDELEEELDLDWDTDDEAEAEDADDAVVPLDGSGGRERDACPPTVDHVTPDDDEAA